MSGAINVEVVIVSGSDNAAIGMQLKKGAVVLVGLDYHIVAMVVDHDVRVEIFGYATEKSTTSQWSVAKNVSHNA